MVAQGDKEDLETAELFLPLLKMKGWHAYLALLDHHIEMETRKVLVPCESASAAFALESHKGAIIGLRLARGVVGDILRHAEEIRKNLRPEDEV